MTVSSDHRAYLQIRGRLEHIECAGLTQIRRAPDELWIELPNATVAIGRAAAPSGPYLRVRSDNVARRHCMLEAADGAWSLRDRESSGGTYVNDERLCASVRVLQPGDVISIGAAIGGTRAVFRREPPPECEPSRTDAESRGPI